MEKVNEKLKKACVDAITSFDKINEQKFSEIRSKLEYVIGSYEFDKNPIGLHEIGTKALKDLTTYKKENNRKVTKKVIDTIGKAITNYELKIGISK